MTRLGLINELHDWEMRGEGYNINNEQINVDSSCR